MLEHPGWSLDSTRHENGGIVIASRKLCSATTNVEWTSSVGVRPTTAGQPYLWNRRQYPLWQRAAITITNSEFHPIRPSCFS